MLDPSVAKGYSQALFAVAKQQGRSAEIGRELAEFVRAVDELDQLRVFWVGLRLPVSAKMALLSRIVAGRVSPLATRFLEVLVKRRREQYLRLIAARFADLVRRDAGREAVEVVSAVPLSDALRTEITRLAAGLTEKRGLSPEVTFHVKAEVVGGIRFRAGDYLVDGTVRSGLQRLKRRLSGTASR
jgi:F-type H+-transporting ATPase subunit delta